MSELIESTRDGIARLTLNRPAQLNSLTSALCAALQDALGRAAADPAVRCVLLTGSGRAFCAGQDLADIGLDSDHPRQLDDILDHDINPVVRLMRSMDKPVVCAVNGVAAGAGANIALAGDIVVAAASARFIQAFRRIGLIPDGGGTWLLPRLAGDARALGMCLLGEPVDAATAERWGMIWKCFADDEAFEAGVESICRSLAEGPGLALALTKRALRQSGGHSLDAQLDLERDLQRSAGQSQDYLEGVSAFFDKRTPAFRGR
jgi:2-(1,2-epoxy-1,2-dihydrophenyl)acetyl-CoA isomerase